MQVCALAWNRHERELLSSHGFSQNQLCLWRYPSMTKVAHHRHLTTNVHSPCTAGCCAFGSNMPSVPLGLSRLPAVASL